MQIPTPGGTSLSFPNPFGMAHLSLLRTVPVGTLDGLFVAFAAFLTAAFVSLAVRYRAGDRLLRQQVKWLALIAAMLVVAQLIALLVLLLGQPWLSGIADTLVAIIVLVGIPAAMTIAILRDRLYDIDRIISLTVTYAIVTGLLVGVYAGLVLLATPVLPFSTPVAVAVSMLAAAALATRCGFGFSRWWTRGSTGPATMPTAPSPRSQSA